MQYRLLALFSFFASGLHATVVYNNFTGGNTGVGYNTGFLAPVYSYIYAQGFNPSGSGALDQITLSIGVSQNSAPPNFANVFLYQNNGGFPGAVLEQIVFDVGSFYNPANSPANLVVTANSALHPLLTAGTDYFIGLSAVDPVNHPLGWYFSLTAPQAGEKIAVFYQGAWVYTDPQPQYALGLRVLTGSSVVPEPNLALLIGFGLAAFAGWKRLSAASRVS